MNCIDCVMVAGLVVAASTGPAFAETSTVDFDFSKTQLTCKEADLVIEVTPDGDFRIAGQVRINNKITSLFEQWRKKLRRPVIACISTAGIASHRATELVGLARNPEDSVVFLEGESWTQVKLVKAAVTKD